MKHLLFLSIICLFISTAKATVNETAPDYSNDSNNGVTSLNHPQKIWYCRADSYVTGRWYYWRSYNAAYARNMVMNACISENGYTCRYYCM